MRHAVSIPVIALNIAEDDIVEALRRAIRTADSISSPELMLRSLRAVKGSKLVLFEGVDHRDLTDIHRTATGQKEEFPPGHVKFACPGFLCPTLSYCPFFTPAPAPP